MNRVFSKKLGGYIDEIFDIIGDKLEDINPYFKDKPTTTDFNQEVIDDMERLGFDPSAFENLEEYDFLKRRKTIGKAPKKETFDPDIPTDEQLRMLDEEELLNYQNNAADDMPIEADDMPIEEPLFLDSDFEDMVTEERLGGVPVKELPSYYSKDPFPESDIKGALNAADDLFETDIENTMRKYDIFGGVHNENTRSNVGFNLIEDSEGFGIGQRLLSYYSPVENTISALRFPEKGLPMGKIQKYLSGVIPKLGKKLENNLGGLRLKLNELQALDPNKLYNKKEIMDLYKEHGIYIEARILKGNEAKFFNDQRLPIKKLRLESRTGGERVLDLKIPNTYFEIDISATTQAGNRRMLNLLQETESGGVRPLSANFRSTMMFQNPMLQQGHYKPTNLAHARGVLMQNKGVKSVLVEEIQQDPQNIIGLNRALKRTGDLDPSDNVLTAKLPSVEFVSQIIQALIVHAKKEGADEIIFPSAFRIAQQRTTPNLAFEDVPQKYIDVYEKGVVKYINDLIDESGGKIKMREEVLSFDASPNRSTRDRSKIINIKDFDFDVKESKARFSKGGLVQKRGLMERTAAA